VTPGAADAPARPPPPPGGRRGTGELSQSWAGEIAQWLRRLPAELRPGTEQVLAGGAAAEASLEDLATITARALALWQAAHPDPEDEGGFADRYLAVGTTFGRAGVIRGDLTPECAAAVTAVLQALGKNAAPGDDHTEGQRFHDALQLACVPLPRVCLLVDWAACRMVRTFAGQPKSSWRTAADLGGMPSSGKNSAHI
jgi:hypothetical protein